MIINQYHIYNNDIKYKTCYHFHVIFFQQVFATLVFHHVQAIGSASLLS